MSSTTNSSWIPSLAGYRALAALAVFGFHIASIKPPEGPLGEWTLPLGSAAVSVFFALSGFLIYRPFAAWALASGVPVAGGRFVLRRAARILPLYWTVLTIHLFVFGRGGAQSLGDYLTAYTLIQNFRGSLVFIPPFVAWSLSIELWFSISLPALAGVLRWLGKGRNLRARLFVQLFGFAWLAGSATVFRMWALSRPRGGGQLLWMPAYLDWFAAGIVLSILTTYWRVKPPPITIRRLAANPAPIAAVGVVAYWTVTKIGVPGGFVPTTVFQTHTQFLLQALMSMCLLAAAVLPNAQLGLAGRLLSSRPLAWIGSLSYGIYLIHPVVIDEFLDRWDISRPVLAPVTLALTILSAYAIHRLVEGPAARLVDGQLGHVTSGQVTSGQVTSSSPASGDATSVQEATTPTTVPTKETTHQRIAPAGPPQDPIMASINRLPILATLTAALSAVLTLLARPGVYVADARYELFADPFARMSRSFSIWDPTRDLGRAAEEFWPGLVLFSSIVTGLGAPEWVNERLLHATLLTVGAVGAMALSRTLARRDLPTTVFAGILYGFGPFSALYLVPSPLYVSYAIAPWIVTSVLRASRNQSTLRWAGIASLLIFLAGNADPPGLIFALVPAIITWLALLIARPASRKPLAVFTLATLVSAGLASAAMLVKTSAGAAALSHRLVETESAEAVAAASSFAESFRGMGFWLSYLRLGPTVFHSQNHLFLDNWFMILLTFIPLVVGIGALARRPGHARPSDLLAVSWLISAVVLMSGPHPIDSPSPYGHLLLGLYERSDLAFGFRSTHKAGVGLALATAILGAAGLAALIRAAVNRLDSVRWLPTALVAALLLSLTQPFWRTDLYDPALASSELPEHWEETAQWFRENPPSGRVLVLPGTTNNGYRWGSVGDDLLDPIIPNRLVASTLPLSTQLGADLTQAIDDALTSLDYQAGTLAPLAQRLGISHVVIRNDLDWVRQGVGRPRNLQPLRADPDLRPVAGFGAEGLYSSSPLDPDPSQLEGELPAVEILTLNPQVARSPSGFWRIPDTGQARQIVLSGDGDGMVDAAASGLLDGGHPVRYSAGLSGPDLAALAPDVALIVLTDSNTQTERKINYYGYDEIPLLLSQAAQSTSNNHWLPAEFRQPGANSTVDLRGAKVDSTIDPWSLGPDHQPLAAIDQDPTTSWLLPFLSSAESPTWSIEFSAPNSSTSIEIQLLDKGERAQNIEILLDGAIAEFSRSGDVLLVQATASFHRLEVRLSELAAGLDGIGIREVSFGSTSTGLSSPQIVTSMPSDVVDTIRSSPGLEQQFRTTPLSVIVGGDAAVPGVGAAFGTDFVRSVNLWRSDTFTLHAPVTSTSPDVRCTKQILSIDGEPVAVQFTPSEPGEDRPGQGRLSLCPTSGPLQLSAGIHRIEFHPLPGYLVGPLRLDSDHPRPEPLLRLPLNTADHLDLEEGDLLLSEASFDAGWQLDPGALDTITLDTITLDAVAFDTLTGWHIPTDMTVQVPNYQDESKLNIALVLSFLGVVIALGLALLPTRVTAIALSTSTRSNPQSRQEPTTGRRNQPRSIGAGSRAVLALALLCVSYFFVGPYGLLGAGIGLLIRRFRPSIPLFGLAAIGLFGVAILSALPLLTSSASLVQTSGEARLARVVVGLLLVATATSLDRSTGDLDDTVP